MIRLQAGHFGDVPGNAPPRIFSGLAGDCNPPLLQAVQRHVKLRVIHHVGLVQLVGLSTYELQLGHNFPATRPYPPAWPRMSPTNVSHGGESAFATPPRCATGGLSSTLQSRSRQPV